MDVLQSRESLSKQENGERRVQPGITKQFINKYNDPWVALEAANEYIGWGVTRLDGPAADNRRSSVQLKLEEELNEALKAIVKVEISGNSNCVQSMDYQYIQGMASKIVDVVHWALIYLGILCETYNISWLQLWEEHYSKLRSKGYVV
ncbi:XRE family transcriptional regulator [Halobacillus shinanisalinarum]|uniref:XRE family transcriptional regulator n=1 Tax=Halobacillus shinanisalinarum TaxID=2932258 RepID=A0ABY4H3R5_9BACI|nr:XRE family transcriptional regulator [Halobacillus shinanisalinarum]UOQ95095.1 XRE family transcriptional regulator [Halobacillus shinanisalinarum]